MRRVSSLLLRTAMTLSMVAVLLLVLLGLGILHRGGRFFVVSTPSMGGALPVGSLAITMPASKIVNGEVIAFRPPTQPGTVFTHRVVSGNPVEGWKTRGDLNSSNDPWLIRPRDVIGVVRMDLVDIGWLMRFVPFLGIGALLAGCLYLILNRRHRHLSVVVGMTGAVALYMYLFHPLLDATVMTYVDKGGIARAAVINWGILAAKFSVNGGMSKIIQPGTVGVITGGVQNHGSIYIFSRACLSTWQWVIMISLCIWPIGFLMIPEPPQAKHTYSYLRLASAFSANKGPS